MLPGYKAADADYNGAVNIFDVSIIVKYLAGYPEVERYEVGKTLAGSGDNTLPDHRSKPLHREYTNVKIDGTEHRVHVGDIIHYQFYLDMSYGTKLAAIEGGVFYSSDGLQLLNTWDDYEEDYSSVLPNIGGGTIGAADDGIALRYVAMKKAGYNFNDSKVLVNADFKVIDGGSFTISNYITTLIIEYDQYDNYYAHAIDSGNSTGMIDEIEEFRGYAEVDCPHSAPTEVPTEAPTEAPTEPEVYYLRGDADCDGVITIMDATVIQRRLYELSLDSYSERNADADADGEVTILDATRIQLVLACVIDMRGIPVDLPEVSPTCHTYPYDIPDDGLFVMADGVLYKVNRGQVIDYIYYLNTGEKLCSLDAETFYDTSGLTLLNDTEEAGELYPIIDYNMINRAIDGRLIYNYSSYKGKYFNSDDSELVHMQFSVDAYSGVYEINTLIHTAAGADMHRYIFEDQFLSYPKRYEGVVWGINPYTGEEPTLPIPTMAPTEAPTMAPTVPPTICSHYNQYSVDVDFEYYDWGYTYYTITYCADCGEGLDTHPNTVYYPTEPPTQPPTQPPTEPPTEPYHCEHWDTYDIDGEKHYYDWGYTYTEYTYCEYCGECLWTDDRVVYYPTEPPTEPYHCDHGSTYRIDGEKYYYDWGYTYTEYTYCDYCGELLDMTERSVEYGHETDPTEPDEPMGRNVISFDTKTAGWRNFNYVAFHIWAVDDDRFAGYDWGSKKQRGADNDGDGVWTYDLDAHGLTIRPGKQYVVIFYNSNMMQTYNLLFDSTCMGDTAYCDGTTYENPEDSHKIAQAAFWRDAKREYCGPEKRITSIGNIVGECIPHGTTAYDMFIEFLEDKLRNARDYSGKNDQQIIDDMAKALGLSKSDVSQAVDEARAYVDWKESDSTASDSGSSGAPSSGEPVETDKYGYVVGAYYLAGTINGYDSPETAPDAKLRFVKNTKTDLILSSVRLTKGDRVTAVRYNGGNYFTSLPAASASAEITQSGTYTIYFKPYELGDPGYCSLTPVLSKEQTGILGDADDDGEVTILDATTIQRTLASLPVESFNEAAADADGDGEVTILDATSIQRYLAGLAAYEGIGKPV